MKRLFTEVHAFSHALRFGILQAIANAISERQSSSLASVPNQVAPLSRDRACVFAGQLVIAATFLLLGQDRERLQSILDALDTSQTQIATSAAFVSTTFIWKCGDRCSGDKDFIEAAAWFVLGAHPVMRASGRTTWPKSLRSVT